MRRTPVRLRRSTFRINPCASCCRHRRSRRAERGAQQHPGQKRHGADGPVHVARFDGRDSAQRRRDNGLKVSRRPTSLISDRRAPRPRTVPAGATAATGPRAAVHPAERQCKLFTYRLKHASAVQLAPVLTSLFTGSTGNFGNGFQVFNPNGNGLQTSDRAAPAAWRPPGAGRRRIRQQRCGSAGEPEHQPERQSRSDHGIVTQTPGGSHRAAIAQQIQAGALSSAGGRHPHHRRGIERTRCSFARPTPTGRSFSRSSAASIFGRCRC